MSHEFCLPLNLMQVRQAFCAAEGNSLVVADYGQLELRVLAHMTNCRSMIDAFEQGGDFHSRTALGMYDNVKEAVKNGKGAAQWPLAQVKAASLRFYRAGQQVTWAEQGWKQLPA